MDKQWKTYETSGGDSIRYYMEHHHIFLENKGLINLEYTFENGQVFHYKKISDGEYVWITRGRKWLMKSIDNLLIFYDVSEEEFLEDVVNMFDFDVSYDKLLQREINFSSDIENAIQMFKGMRILRQTPWETVVSFIISANNNITKIKMSVEALCERFGKDLGDGFYDWPEASVLARAELTDIRVKALGYRDKYLKATALMIDSGKVDLSDEKMSYETLMKLPGVGRKVADCILLFGYHQLDVVPVDTWVKKMGKSLFNQDKPDAIKQAFNEAFGEYAGIYQQYLFHYYRKNY